MGVGVLRRMRHHGDGVWCEIGITVLLLLLLLLVPAQLAARGRRGQSVCPGAFCSLSVVLVSGWITPKYFMCSELSNSQVTREPGRGGGIGFSRSGRNRDSIMSSQSLV